MTVQYQDITERPVLLLGWDANRTVYPTGVGSSEAVGTVQANATVAVSGIAATDAVGTAQVNASAAVSGINAGTGAAGTPSVVLVASPAGVEGSAAAGAAATTAGIRVSSVDPSGAVGAPTAFTSMNPSGFVEAGAAGSPSLTPLMAPAGIASGEAFGDADTLATVFIIPGPVDPSNDFGTVNVVRNGLMFRTPRTTYQWRIPPFKEYEGVSLLREGGVWSEVQHPDLERTLAAQVYLGGGRDHFVTETTRDELVALGYTVTEEIIR